MVSTRHENGWLWSLYCAVVRTIRYHDYWPEPSAEEYSHNNKALAKDVVVFSTMIFILFYLSSTINEVAYDFPMSQLIGSLITSSVMMLVMFLCRFKIRFLVLLATTVDVTYHFFFCIFFYLSFSHTPFTSLHFFSC